MVRYSPHMERSTTHMTFNTMREAREAKGMSQAQLADALGISLGLVSRMESGERKPSNATVYLLATLFRKPIADVARWFGSESQKAA